MSLTPAVAPAELERKHPESAAKESPVQDTTFHSLSGVFGALGANGSDETNSHLAKNPLLQRRGNGETRTLIMRRLQQGAGNHKTQQFVAQLRRPSVIQRECACGGMCSSCQEKGVEEEEGSQILRRQSSATRTPGGTVDADVIPSDSPGQPLDRSTREFMEPRFGSDFSDVRVHTDSRAAQSADALAANAYTTGRDIYFAAGKYAPASQNGQHLLVHELTHTVQQAAGKRPSVALALHNAKIGLPDDILEVDAERTASEFTSGSIPSELVKPGHREGHPSSGAVQRIIQRQGSPGSDAVGLASQASPENASIPTTGKESLTCEMEAPAVCTAEPQPSSFRSPGPGPRTVTFGGYVLSPEPAYLRSVLGEIGAAKGLPGMDWFVTELGVPEEELDGASAEVSAGAGQGSEAVYSPEELQLLTEIAPLMRSELDQLMDDYRAFGAFVRDAAIVRVRRNHHNLGLWRDYVLSLAPSQVMGMAAAQKEERVLMESLHSRAQGPFNPMDVYEQRSRTTSRWMRDYYERLGTGQIHDGCEQCHERKSAEDMEYLSPTVGGAAIPLAMRMPIYAELNKTMRAPGKEIASDEKKPLAYDWAFSAIGDRPGSQAIATSLFQMLDYLKPLGDAGYRVISDQTVKDATDGSQLVTSIIAAIDARREGYLDLIEKLKDPGYNFLELTEILNQLLPFADPDVRSVVEGERKRLQEEKEAEANTGLILTVAALLLTIFPPTAPLGIALGVGLAVSGLESGYESYEQGRRFEMGTGAQIFTREQEDSARAMQAMGIITMALSAFAIVDAGVGGARLLRAPATGAAVGAAEEVVGVEATSGDLQIRVEGLDGPSPTVEITQADGTMQELTVDEVEAMASKTEPGAAEELRPGTTETTPKAGGDFGDFEPEELEPELTGEEKTTLGPGEDPNLDPAICFPHGTPVSTQTGLRAIETLSAGETVFAYDFESKTVVVQPILGLTRGSTLSWVHIYADGEVLRATKSHPFWVESARAWIEAEKLTPGMVLRRQDGRFVELTQVEVRAQTERQDTYNLSVDRTENFFVGALRVLVHNIAKSRLIRLSRPGYSNYVLRSGGPKGRIYYSGMYGPETKPAQVQARHAANGNRFNPEKDFFELKPGTREYGDARLMEQRIAVENKTIIGRDGENYRGNRQSPIAEDKLAEYKEYETYKQTCG
jgi:hypothetical protein